MHPKIKTVMNSKWLAGLIGFAFVLVLIASSTHKSDLEQQHAENVSGQKVGAVFPKGRVNFAGEVMPLTQNDIRERLDKELTINTYYHSSTILIMKRAAKFFPIIEPILAEKGIPEDFKYLAVAESGLQNVSSPAKASGFWQFLPRTGREYGLEVNDYIDERYHLEKATYAACDYIKERYNEFGDWTLVAASYNMGSAGLRRRLKEQEVDSYYDLYLNSETARYVFRIVALKEIMSNPARYGFTIPEDQKYEQDEYALISVDTTINSLPKFATKIGTNYKTIKTLNPWLRDKVLMNKSRQEYLVKIPR